MRYNVVSSTVCLAPSFLYTLSLYYRRKLFIWHICVVWFFSTNFVWNISHSKIDLAKYCHICTSVFVKRTCFSSNVSGFSSKVPVFRQMYLFFFKRTCFSSQILIKTWIFETFSKSFQTSNFLKIDPVGEDLFPADGRTKRPTDTIFSSNIKSLCSIVLEWGLPITELQKIGTFTLLTGSIA